MRRLVTLLLAAAAAGCTDVPTTTGLASLKSRADLLEFAGATVQVDAYFLGQLIPPDPEFWPIPGVARKGPRHICEVTVWSDAASATGACGNPVAVPPGDYTIEVYWAATSPVLVEQVTLANGEYARRAVDVDAIASRVRGRFVLNGEPEAGREYCILRELGFSFCHKAGADGTFDVMAQIGSVGIRRMGGAETVHMVEGLPGQITEVGDITVATARIALDMTYLTQPVSPDDLANCSAHIESTSGNLFGIICGQAIDLPHDVEGTLHVSFWDHALPTQPVSASVGQTIRRTVDLSAVAGILTTSGTLAGAPLSGAQMCFRLPVEFSSFQPCKTVDAAGSASFLAPVGTVQAFVDIAGVTEPSTLTAEILAGQTTALAPINAAAATVRLDVQFNSETGFPQADCNAGIGSLPGTKGTFPLNCPGATLVMPGTHLLQRSIQGSPLPSQEITLVADETYQVAVEVGSVVGLLVGRVTLSGRPLPPEANLCVTASGGKLGGKTNGCTSPDANGQFRLFVPPGTWFLHVADLRSAEAYTVAAGQKLEVGEPELPDYTPPGSNVEVSPIDQTTQAPSPIGLTFSNVSTGGATTVTSTGTGEPLQGFKLGNPPVYYDIQTTATFSGAIKVCINYAGQSFGNESAVKLLHHDGSRWEDVTLPGYPDLANDIICGEVTSLSPFTVAEQNFHPIVTGISLPAAPVAVGTAASIQATFTDANPTDVHTATIDWDGAVSAGSLAQAAGGGVVTGQRAFTQPGVYTISVNVSDGEFAGTRSSMSDAPAYIVVYDPSGGFVTGGGWIMSPAGAYAGDPGLTGKATFGFVSKYAKGASTPTGKTEFHFSAGNLRFRSETYQWLVTAGARAQFKGTGDINGVAGYGFLITAIDGAVSGGGGSDKFRIRIWDVSTGSVVYDNNLGAAEDSDAATILGGGSIQIHRN